MVDFSPANDALKGVDDVILKLRQAAGAVMADPTYSPDNAQQLFSQVIALQQRRDQLVMLTGALSKIKPQPASPAAAT